ncbi:YihY/virulence factor BrkB family protein [Mucilaginibacter terrae]|uniref:Membrane protein n=1 Tax=Mucilaginibacter terrae TaxID=1955052 RepID=A0ABU3GUL0_9SPHI|nr:YihY/virulence factor BrkB family protein [Mucilaginibacter terrae]MDT3403459.1 membrane protein [Mucilaginibacter terrae]
MKVFSKDYLKSLWKVLMATFSSFSNDNGLKLSASLAYYTIFSIAPLLVLILALAGLFWPDTSQASTKLYAEMSRYVGADAAKQIQDIIKNLQFSGKTGVALASGIITLLLGASSIFLEIQDSINMIWRVKAKPKKGWLKMLQNRFLSFSLIISLGFLLLASLIVNVIVSAVGSQLTRFMPAITERIIELVNLGISFIVISTLFGIIFKFLPDVKIKFKDVRSGAFFTAILFMLGQFIISLYIKYSAQGSAYGAAGSVIVILVWIYYTAAILYIGAEFTRVYAEVNCSHIEPAEYAVHVEQTEVERHVKELPPQNPELKAELQAENDKKGG